MRWSLSATANDAQTGSNEYGFPAQRAGFSRWSVIACGVMIIVTVGRIMEIVPALAPFRIGILALIAALFLSIAAGRLKFRVLLTHYGAGVVLVYAGIAAMSVPFSVWPGGALESWWNSFPISILLLFIMVVNMRTGREIAFISIAIIVCVTTLASGVVLFPSKEIIETGGIYRYSTSEMYDPNDLALIMVTGIPLALAHFFHARIWTKPAWLAVVLLMGFAVLKTASRGGFIAFCVVGVLLAAIHTQRTPRLIRALLVASALVMIVLISPEELWKRMLVVINGNDYNYQIITDVDSAPGRLQIWTSAIAMINPKFFFLGVGIGQFATAMGNRYGRFFFSTAHNSFLQAFGELGCAGLIIFSLLLIQIWRNNRIASRLFLEDGKKSLLADLPRYANLSLAGFVVSSLFLSSAYSTMLPVLLAYSISLRRFAEHVSAISVNNGNNEFAAGMVAHDNSAQHLLTTLNYQTGQDR